MPKQLSEQHKRNISLGLKGKKRKPMSEEQKKFLSEFWTGKRTGEDNPSKRPEVREKLVANHWSRKQPEKFAEFIDSRRGKPRTESVKLAISNKNKGEGNAGWIDGRSKSRRYGVGFTIYLKKKIKNRDGCFCQVCSCSKNLDVHHIDYDKNNNSWDNLIALCKSCHSKTNWKRDKWKLFFRDRALLWKIALKHDAEITLLPSDGLPIEARGKSFSGFTP